MRSSTVLVVVTMMLLCRHGLSQTGVPQPVLSAAPQTSQPNPPPSAPSASTDPPEVSAGYIIGPQDALQVTVWKEANLSGPLTVRPDGMISLPLIGDVPASGMTPTQLGSDLATRLKKYITDPLVTVTLLAVNSKHIFLLGEVQRIGPMAMSPGITILQAISSAGGLSPFANSKHIYILRGFPGSQKKIFFDYKKAIKHGDEQGIVLQPGDTIVVP